MLATFVFTASAAAAAALTPSTTYFIDDTRGPARTFDGIGGLSGGGATSVLLRDYPEPQRSNILDLLFKPNFGASLHILKVEIGGDAQSTDGSESSHMHDPWTTDYTRGYEWFLIQQAKARNPAIKLYGLPWAFPQWVSCNPGSLANCSNNPYDRPEQTAAYLTSWVSGVKSEYGFDTDYVGCWNERGYNMPYIETLRASLDAAGFGAVKVVVADSSFGGVSKDINSNPAFAAAVWGVGAHYPNMQSGPDAEATGKQLWASEEDSTYSNAVGAGCWARVINQNYVRGNMSASINWNLISAYMKGTNWWRAGLFTAFQPWSGAFGALAMVWATAHTTQFAQPGSWAYLANGTGAGTGAGLLVQGGSYVTLQNFATGDFSIVIEKMSRDHSPCCRPGLPAYFAGPENATFTLVGGPAKAASLQLWRTHYAFGAPGDVGSEFVNLGAVPVVGGAVTLLIEVDSLYTLTTLTTGNKGSFPAPPPPAVFPAAHVDDFNACATSAEAPYWSDQNGAFECTASGDPAHGTVMRQMVPLEPIAWGGDVRPHSLLGARDMRDVSFAVDVRLGDANGSAVVGTRLAGTTYSHGPFGALWAVNASGAWNLTGGIATVQTGPAYASGTLPGGFGVGVWRTVRVDVNGSTLNIWVDGAPAATALDVSWAGASGHAGIGTVLYAHYTEFDNVALYSTQTACSAAPPAAAAPIVAVPCASEVGARAGGQLAFTPLDPATCPYGSPCGNSSGTFAIAALPTLCLSTAGAAGDNAWPVVLAACDPADAAQVFTQAYAMLYDSAIVHAATGRRVATLTADIGSPAVAAKSTAGLFAGQFVFVGDEAEIVSINDGSICLGTC